VPALCGVRGIAEDQHRQDTEVQAAGDGEGGVIMASAKCKCKSREHKLQVGVPITVPPWPVLQRGGRPRLRTKNKQVKIKTETSVVPGMQPNEMFGPLNRQIKSRKSFVSQFIEEHFDLTALSIELRKTIASDEAHRPKHRAFGLTGTAIDYRIRAYFLNQPHECDVINSALKCIGQDASTKISSSLSKFFRNLRPARKFLFGLDERQTCEYCIVLAKLDLIYRGILLPEEELVAVRSGKVKEIIKLIDSQITDDLIRLSMAFCQTHKDLIRHFRRATGGSTLAGSQDVIGADFDLLVDGCLFEFKTTINPTRNLRSSLRQVIAYWLLDYDNKFRIRSLAVCFPRQNCIRRFEIHELPGSKLPPQEIRKQFRNRMRAFNRGNSPNSARRNISNAHLVQYNYWAPHAHHQSLSQRAQRSGKSQQPDRVERIQDAARVPTC
jgi:hypothetical protein